MPYLHPHNPNGGADRWRLVRKVNNRTVVETFSNLRAAKKRLIEIVYEKKRLPVDLTKLIDGAAPGELRFALYAYVAGALSASKAEVSAQLCPCRAFGEAKGWQTCPELVFIDDGTSGDSIQTRAELATLTKATFQDVLPFRVVLVDEFSRLFHDTTALSQFKRMLTRNGVRLLSVSNELNRASKEFRERFIEKFSKAARDEEKP